LSGYRATTDALNGGQRDAVRDRLLRSLRSRSVTTLQTDVIYGTATRRLKPGSATGADQASRTG
jgi:hypothetical protein